MIYKFICFLLCVLAIFELDAQKPYKQYTGICPVRYDCFSSTGFKVEQTGDSSFKIDNKSIHVKFGSKPKSFIKVKPAEKKHLDLSAFVGIRAKIKNLGSSNAVVRANIIGYYWSCQTAVYICPGKTEEMFLIMRRQSLAKSDVRREMGNMHGKPGGYVSGWQKLDASQIKGFQLEILDSKQKTTKLQISDIHAYGIYGLDTIEYDALFPFVDKYGQYINFDWKEKINSDEELIARKEQEKTDLLNNPGCKDISQYGGWLKGPKLKSTGHFRVTKYKGKWYFVDPSGYLFWSLGVNCVRIDGGANASNVFRKFFASMPKCASWQLKDGRARIKHGQANCLKKYGSLANYYPVVFQRLKSWGFNTLGGWSERHLYLKRKIPYTLVINSTELSNIKMDQLIKNNPEKFRLGLRKRLMRYKRIYGEDPWCVGWFIDNEIRWNKCVSSEAYYRIVSEEMKRVVPKILYLGSRFFNTALPYGADEKTARWAAKYCDVIGINRYRYTPNSILLPKGIDKPVIIGEFSFGALDAGMLHPGCSPVTSQEQRAMAYKHYLEQAAKHPNIVGAHWFQYFSQSLTGRWDGENNQIGLVDITDTPYAGMVKASRKFAYALYKNRMKK